MHLLSRLLGRQSQEDIKPSIQQAPKEVETTIEGRRHRVDTADSLPKDAEETNRLDFQHYALQKVIGANHKAPIDPNFLRSILDVGDWYREMGYGSRQRIPTYEGRRL